MRFDGSENRVTTPDKLSPEARKLYEESVERVGEAQSRIWLEYRDHYVLDDDMHVIPAAFAEWAVMYEKPWERQIRRDEIGHWLISTVFLGLDHGFNFNETKTYQPVVFETMIFNHGDTRKHAHWLEERCWRYCTTQEAVAGHAHAVEVVRRHLKLPRKLKKALTRDHERLTFRQHQMVAAYARTL